MKPKFMRLLETCIVDGVVMGHNRAYKHNDSPEQYEINQSIVEEVLNEIHEWFDIDWGSKPDKGEPVIKSEWEELVDALKSIANSSCCNDCQEAKRIAEVALYQAGVVSSIPVRGTYDDIRQCPETLKTQIKTEDGWKELYGEPNTYDWKQEYSHMYWTLKDLLKRSKGATDIAKVVNELEKIHATFPNPTKV